MQTAMLKNATANNNPDEATGYPARPPRSADRNRRPQNQGKERGERRRENNPS